MDHEADPRAEFDPVAVAQADGPGRRQDTVVDAGAVGGALRDLAGARSPFPGGGAGRASPASCRTTPGSRPVSARTAPAAAECRRAQPVRRSRPDARVSARYSTEEVPRPTAQP
ncbi:hypothetical protein GCM10017687_80400 [Streptomyces echinatus]